MLLPGSSVYSQLVDIRNQHHRTLSGKSSKSSEKSKKRTSSYDSETIDAVIGGLETMWSTYAELTSGYPSDRTTGDSDDE
jgi:hypothetical protein